MLKRFLVLFFIAFILAPPPAVAIKYKGELEANESVTFPEQGSTPTNPASTKHKLYLKDDGIAYTLDSSGNENPVGVAALKNKLINGGFDLWQRGTSFATPSDGTYGPDRWTMWPKAGNTLTFSRQAFTLGQTDVPGEPAYYFRMDKTAGAGGNPEVRHRIEDVRTFAGQTATASFYAKASAARNLLIEPLQSSGSGGSGSGAPTGQNVALTTSWQKFTLTFDVPSISGFTLGTGHYLTFRFRWNDTSNGTIDVARVQFEKGSVATEFENRHLGVELALAERYYQKTFPYDTAPAQNAGIADALCYNVLLAGVNKFNLNWYLKTPMRTDPTITYFNPSAANTQFRNTPDAGDSGTPATDVLSPNYIFIRNPQVATDAVGEQVCIHATADAEL